jgi:hypothetical protein
MSNNKTKNIIWGTTNTATWTIAQTIYVNSNAIWKATNNATNNATRDATHNALKLEMDKL